MARARPSGKYRVRDMVCDMPGVYKILMVRMFKDLKLTNSRMYVSRVLGSRKAITTYKCGVSEVE